jgi:hypothetical protein
MKNAVFWMRRHVIPVRSDVSEELIASIIRVKRISELRTIAHLHIVLQLLGTANVVPSSPILVALMMEAIRSSKTPVLTRSPKSALLFVSEVPRLIHFSA